jgi:threonine dehydrogenase-like Zn-dependent dehydrogenase
MRAAVLRDGRMTVRDDVEEPVPGPGQLLVEVKACGICGSDLHFAKHGAELVGLMREMGGGPYLGGHVVDLDRDVFMGHEFAAEVLELGPDTTGPEPGTLVTSVPIMLSATGIQDLAYSNDLPSGYSERMLLAAPLAQRVPNGLDARRAALTEPMAVGLHAVNKSAIGGKDGAVVLGCGPVGIAVIAALGLKGVAPILASDYSAMRRSLAAAMGAHSVVDPATENVFEAWDQAGGSQQLVVFEAVGVPGVIDVALRSAPRNTRLVIVGVCMGRDQITPFFGIAKELSVQFCLGYDLEEFSGSLKAIADGDLDVSSMITGEVGLDGVAGAFEDLGTPDRHCKILVTHEAGGAAGVAR